ncbi:hypothetical protein LY76DRAFT_631620 [Colletotrichum caudatum]|nr:hypothetical protein LY76DRAFT_631620 [Colletotrichum caudatum]
MPLVKVSAVTNQQEIYDHCTVYHYDPGYQNQGGRENLYVTAATGNQEQQAAHAQAHANPLESPSVISQTMMNGLDASSFPAKSYIGGRTPHHWLPMVGGSFNETCNAFPSPEQEKIHGLEAFSLQDSTSLDTHGSSIWSADSFDMTVSPAVLSQFDEQAFDELFRQVSESSFEVEESHVKGKVEGLKDDTTLTKTT